jgi:hypothetical protein
MGKKKKVYIAPKHADQESLYDKLRAVRERSIPPAHESHSLEGDEQGLSRQAQARAETAERDAGSYAPGATEEFTFTEVWLETDGEGNTTIGGPLGEQPPELTDPVPPPNQAGSSPVEGYVQAVPTDTGVYHTPVPEVDLSFKIAPNEYMIRHGGSYIVLGTDRPGSVMGGKGAKGYQNANMIDLCVGRMASARGTKGPAAGTHVDNSAPADAARIYISQLTDIDVNFGLAEGISGVAVDGSGIGVKADDVRIIGKRSVKIVTGKQQAVRGAGPRGEPTSLGFAMHQPAPTIELIAGNHTEERVVWGGIYNPIERINTLQRACLGSNTRDGLAELNDIVGELWSAVFNLTLYQTGFNSIVGIDPWRPWVAAASPTTVMGLLGFVLDSLWHTKINAILWELNYLTPYGYKFICSTNVKIT